MFKYIQISLIILSLLSISCIRNNKKPGRQYMADMVESTAYEAGSPNPIFKDGKTNQLAPQGSVAQGKFIYSLPNTTEAYEQAATQVSNEFSFTEDVIKGEGKHLYTVYCAICHGDKGDGQGHLVEINKFPPPPSYTSEALLTKPQGQRYHTLMYGKGLMGSYATQLDHRERWLVLEYVNSLQKSTSASTSSSSESESTTEEEASSN